MIDKNELEEILERVETGMTTGEDADKLRAILFGDMWLSVVQISPDCEVVAAPPEAPHEEQGINTP